MELACGGSMGEGGRGREALVFRTTKEHTALLQWCSVPHFKGQVIILLMITLVYMYVANTGSKIKTQLQ